MNTIAMPASYALIDPTEMSYLDGGAGFFEGWSLSGLSSRLFNYIGRFSFTAGVAYLSAYGLSASLATVGTIMTAGIVPAVAFVGCSIAAAYVFTAKVSSFYNLLQNVRGVFAELRTAKAEDEAAAAATADPGVVLTPVALPAAA